MSGRRTNSENVIDFLGCQPDTNTNKKNSSSESPVESSEKCPTDYSTQPPPASSLQTSASKALLEHVRANSIGDYYKVNELVSLANNKIRELLQDNGANNDRSWAASLLAASEEVIETTGNEELPTILASGIAVDIFTVLKLDQFQNMSVISDFSIKILQSCADNVQALVEKHEENHQKLLKLEKERAQKRESDIKQSLQVLKRNMFVTKRCYTHGCKGKLPNCIELNESIFRCSKCKYEFKS